MSVELFVSLLLGGSILFAYIFSYRYAAREEDKAKQRLWADLAALEAKAIQVAYPTYPTLGGQSKPCRVQPAIVDRGARDAILAVSGQLGGTGNGKAWYTRMYGIIWRGIE